MSHIQTSLHAIHQAPISDKEKLIASVLLSLVHPDNGHITLSWAECAKFFGNVSAKTIRNRLAALRAASILHYSTNQFVDITFEAWRGADVQSHQSRLAGIPVPATRENLPEISPTPPVVSEYLSSSPEQEPTHSAPQPLTTEQERTRQMLSEAGVIKADQLARNRDFAHCRDHLLQWTLERLSDPKLKPGALEYRIRNWPPPPPAADPRLRDLRQRWPTDPEQAEQEEFARLINPPSWLDDPDDEFPPPTPASPPAHPPSPALPPEATKLWAKVQRELEFECNPATYDAWLRDIRLAEWRKTPNGTLIRIEAPNQSIRAFLEQRLQPTIRRAFAHSGAPGATFTFTCPQTALRQGDAP